MQNSDDKIDYSNSFHNENIISDKKKLKDICSEAILKANEKANILEPWVNGASLYLIDQFLSDLNKKNRKVILNFKVEQKSYDCFNLINENILKTISNNYSKDKNKKNAYKYSENLSKTIFATIMDYIDYILYESSHEVNQSDLEESKNLDDKSLEFDKWSDVPSIFTSRFKNFERDLLINEYSSKKEDIDNKGMRTLIYGSSQLFYISSNEYFYVISYSPTNEQYYNQKIKEVNKSPNFSFFVFSKEVEDFFITNFEFLNNLHKNYMQFTYLSDTNQNIVNAMGEASLISQYWYTESVNRILKDHDKELKKAKDSKLLAEYIIRYILAAEIDGVDFIEVYPFDRVFMFNNSIFNANKDTKQLTVFEGLLESKVPDENFLDKKFLSGKTQYSYEWEREKSGFGLDRFDPSKKKIKEVLTTFEQNILREKNTWEDDYNKDEETVINNLLVSMLNGDEEYNKTKMLEYKSKYSNDGITYLYSSGTNLKTQIKSLYNLQQHYLQDLPHDEENGIDKGFADILFDDEHKNYFDNVKVVLFSYTPEKEESEKGFTLLLIANDDVPKSLMELKSEKEDLHTALKLLINQHFTIDQRYKEQSEIELEGLTSILNKTGHSIKGEFAEFEKNEYTQESFQNLKEQINNLISEAIDGMREKGRETTAKEFPLNKHADTVLSTSYDFVGSLFSYTKEDNPSKKILSSKYNKNSNEPWHYFAEKIVDLDIKTLETNGRIYKIIWENNIEQKIILTIDFNELQPFTIEWKDLFINDAMYVMLKNACEHSIETFTDDDKTREIFLDIFISNTNENETINIEFTNQTTGICANLFEHINTSKDEKPNNNKKGSNGIGVTNIRKELDGIYGLNRSNIKFTMINNSTIKSVIFLPIRSLKNDSFLATDAKCSSANANILYLEDDDKKSLINKKHFDAKHFKYLHDVRFRRDYEYEKYKLLITDLNIYGETGENDNVTNGIDAIKYYTAKNKTGLVIILSSDISALGNNNFGKYLLIQDPNEIDSFDSSTIYAFNKKELDSKDLELIAQYLERESSSSESILSHNTTPKSTDTHKKQTTPKKMNIFTEKVKFDTIKEVKQLSIADINGKLFISNNLKNDIQNWLNKKVEFDEILSYEISNCEKPEIFTTKLIAFESENNFILKHELLRRNIIILPDKNKSTDKDIYEYVYNTMEYSIPKNGIFGKISHDIFNKMPEFSFYTKDKIEELKTLNHNINNLFQQYYDDYLNASASETSFTDIEIKFALLVTELEKLRHEADSKSNHLGTNIDNLTSILNKLYFIKGI